MSPLRQSPESSNQEYVIGELTVEWDGVHTRTAFVRIPVTGRMALAMVSENLASVVPLGSGVWAVAGVVGEGGPPAAGTRRPVTYIVFV